MLPKQGLHSTNHLTRSTMEGSVEDHGEWMGLEGRYNPQGWLVLREESWFVSHSDARCNIKCGSTHLSVILWTVQ